MTTKFAKPLNTSQLTHVKDMPPLEVVTEGIPAQEHVELTPPAQLEAAHAEPERRGRAFAWALAGVIGFLVVVAGVFALTQFSSSDLTPPAAQEFGTDETASESVYAGPLLGAALPYISDMTIPTIASLPEMTIPSLPDMSIAAFPSIAAMSIPTIASLPEMTIPSIPAISFTSTPTTPVTPTTPTTFPAIPAMSIPSIQSISFPSFPVIPSISVPSIPSFPEIPEM